MCTDYMMQRDDCGRVETVDQCPMAEYELIPVQTYVWQEHENNWYAEPQSMYNT